MIHQKYIPRGNSLQGGKWMKVLNSSSLFIKPYIHQNKRGDKGERWHFCVVMYATIVNNVLLVCEVEECVVNARLVGKALY